jgi:hypothetical protein
LTEADDPSLVAYWNFDEGSGTVAGDSSGNGNTGTLINGPQWVDGVVGNALEFDGVDDKVSVPDSTSLDINGDQMSVEYWIKMPMDWQPGMTTNMNIYTKGDAYVGSMTGGTGAHRFNLAYIFPYPETNKNTWVANTWYHLADVYDGSHIRMYVNGVLDKEEAVTGQIPVTSLHFEIGGAFSWPWLFKGTIDEMAIYNYARTPEQIWADYKSAVPTGELIGYWSFDEGSGSIAYDSSVNGNDGTVNDADWVDGKIDKALDFNGVNSWVEIPSSNSLTGVGQLTLQAWIKADSLSASNQVKGIVGKTTGSPQIGDEYGLQLAAGRIRFYVSNETENLFMRDTAELISTGQWYFVAGTWDGIDYSIYVNGQVVASGTSSSGNSSLTNTPVEIGRIGSYSWTYFDGRIDEVKMYNYSRSPGEIKADYDSVVGLAGYWSFDEGSGSIAYDSSGNGNTGTLMNGPQWVEGVRGTALEFDGTNDYVRIPHSSSLDISGNEITVEYCIKLKNGWYAGYSSVDQIIYDKGDAYTACMSAGSGALRFNIPYLPPYPETNKNSWVANTWYHIANVFDGNEIKIYVNGVLDKTETVVGSVSRSTINLAIGSHCYGGKNFFEGAVDEFAIYDYARTAAEIENDYNLITQSFVEAPYQGQGYAGWCAPTSLAMVLRYYGEEFHGWDYAHDNKLKTNQGVNDLSALGSYVQINYPSLAIEYGYYGILEKNLLFDHVKTDLSNGYPVIVALGKPPTPFLSKEGHAIVIVGYNETGLFVNDPSGYLFTNLLEVALPASCNRAYVSWDAIDDYIVTWPYASTLTIKGTPDPESKFGTMYLLSDNDIAFYDPNVGLYGDRTELYLTQGLNWNYTFETGSIMDPVVDPKLSSLRICVFFSNAKNVPTNLTVIYRIVGSDGSVYSDTKTNYVEPFSLSFVTWSNIEMANRLLQGVTYSIDFSLTDANGFQVDHFTTPPFYWGGQTIQLTETQKHLYLHVYDAQGNHVGLNYVTNQTELGIPGSFYFDDMNGTITVALPSTDEVKIVVDAAYAQDPLESYNVTVAKKTGQGTSAQTYSNSIMAGENQTVVDISQPEPSPSPSPSPSPTQSPEQTPSPSSTPSPTHAPPPTPSPSPQPTESPIPPPEERPLFLYAVMVGAVFTAIGAAAFLLKKRR